MKRLLRRISFLFLCVSFTQLAFSQTKVVTGTILDDKGAPVQGASVAVKVQRVVRPQMQQVPLL